MSKILQDELADLIMKVARLGIPVEELTWMCTTCGYPADVIKAKLRKILNYD